MRFFVTGVNGQLGHAVMNELMERGHEAVGSGTRPVCSEIQKGAAAASAPYVQLDFTDKKAVNQIITKINPDAVIHCAAWTDVDGAETNEENARAVNVGGTKNIVDVCKILDCKMTYISTDYVFDGQGTHAWKPDCSIYNPLNAYGRSKLDGEAAVSSSLGKYFIVRTSWVFGANGNNFVRTMMKAGKTKDKVYVINDQIGTPTYSCDLARLLVEMNETEKYGYYHAANEGGYISWYDFACEIYKLMNYTTKVIPVTTAEYGIAKAIRPRNSRLDTSKLKQAGFKLLPTWKDALVRYLQESTNE